MKAKRKYRIRAAQLIFKDGLKTNRRKHNTKNTGNKLQI